MEVSAKAKWGTAALALAIAFVAGFWPQYQEVRTLREELRTTQGNLAALSAQARVSRLREEAGVVYLEATRKNYGLARERLAELFRLADETVQSPPDDATKQAAGNLLSQRESITAGLSTGDAAVVTLLEGIVKQIYETRPVK